MIPEETVEQVRQSADIVQIIGEYVNLKKMGTSYRGPCPFHQGTNRNFSVDPRKGFYHCFVCNESGTVFTFLQKRLGLSYPDAVKMAGEKAGVEVREIKSQREGPDPREPMWEINAAAASYFQNILWDDPLGEQARAYLAKRHVSREMAERAGLGFAPREIGLMRAYLSTLGFDDQRLLDVGLMVQPEEDSEPRPRFRGRLIFPIFDVLGRNVGFGGRVIGQGEPKYLNSPETAVFSKGKLLYGLNWAKNDIRKDDRILVVEGYFDVMRLMDAGIHTAVAPLGTALTENQAALLSKYSKNVYLLYDSDKAGLKATFRAGDELLKQKVSVRVVTLPSGEDPDTFTEKEGSTGMEAQLNQAIDIFDRKVQILERAGWFAELQKKRSALDRLLPTIRAAADPILRDIYLTRASEATGVAKEVLQREMSGSTRQQQQPESPVFDDEQPTRMVRRNDAERRKSYDARGLSAERELLSAMLANRAWVDIIAERFGTEGFKDMTHKRIFNAVMQVGDGATMEQIADHLEPEDVVIMEELAAAAQGHVDQERTVNDSISKLQARDIAARMQEIDRMLPIAPSTEQDKLIKEKERLRKEINALGQRRYKSFSRGA